MVIGREIYRQKSNIHRGCRLTKREKSRLKRRRLVEAMIGHMKNEGQLDLCYLKGTFGDAIHAILCGVGQNLRWLKAWIIGRLANFLRFFWSLIRRSYAFGLVIA